jgi:small subunit ribosomal protein S6
MTIYEIAVVFRGDLGDDGFSTQIEGLKNQLGESGAIRQIDQWGRRHLAYPIAKQRDGYYLIITAELPPTLPFEIERTLRLNESVLRFLVLRQDS